jgi:hypothetical protein
MERVKLRKFAKRAGAVVLGLVALDLLATAATAIVAWGMFQK